jgi:glycosyltransferase involved in cell wall biosynthesis
MFIKADTPVVSIIMTTYNRADYIVETIASIRDQTYRNWELIILDDGSDDDTEKRVAAIGDERICFFEAARTANTGKLKNLGLEKASGPLIAFIDSDDLWAPGKIEKQVAALKAYPDAGFVVTGGYNFKKPGEPLDRFYRQTQGIYYGDLFLSYFESGLAGFTQALMFRRECLDLAGKFKEVKLFSDVDFIISLARHFKGLILYEDLVYRRLHETNYIISGWIGSYEEGIEIIRDYRKDLPAAIVRNAFFRLYINFGEDHLLRKQRKKAIVRFLKAWKYKPLSIVPLKKIGKTFGFRQRRK